MKKANILAGIFGVIAFFGLAFGAYTTFTDLKTTGDLLVGDDASITGDITVGGETTLANVSGAVGTFTSYSTQPYLILSSTYSLTTTTPTALGQLALDGSYDLYVASGTDNPTQWIKVGGQ